MSHVRFSVNGHDNNDFVLVALPSYRPGNGSIRSGKAKIQVHGLSCTVDVEISRGALVEFADALQQCALSLHGCFSLESSNKSLVLEGEMAPHGHARVKIQASFVLHRQRDDPQWTVSASFACPASSLSATAALLQEV